MLLKTANASLSLDNKALSAKALVLKSTNTVNVTTIDDLKYQLLQHEQIVYERSLIVTDIAANSVEVKQLLIETIKESNDETVIAWADDIIPIDIVRLLNSTRDSSADQSGKDNPTEVVNPGLSSTNIYRLNKSRSG